MLLFYCAARRYDFGRKGLQDGATGYMYGDDFVDDEYSPYQGSSEYKFTGFGGVKYGGMCINCGGSQI